MFVTDIKNSIKDSVRNVKGKLSDAFNSRTVAGMRAAVRGGAIAYRAATLVTGVGLLATASLPVSAAAVVGVAALSAFVTIHDYQKFRNGQQSVLGYQVGGLERGLSGALKRVPLVWPALAL
jgi:hypothetical protein